MKNEGEDTYRHQCLVRWVIKKRLVDRDEAHKWLEDWMKLHKGSKLEQDVKEQFKKGNRGVDGDWR